MFRQSIKSIAILLKYAKLETIIKLFQLAFASILTPLAIYFTQRLIDGITLYVNGEAAIHTLFLWGGLLIFSMFFSATGGFFDGILYVAIKRKLNTHLTPVIVEKFKKLDYACFEDKDAQDTIKRMSNDPQDHIFNLFLNITGGFTIFISVIGSAVIFAQVGIWFMMGFLLLLLPMVWCDFKAANMMNTMFQNQSTDERRLRDLGGLLSNKAAIFELKLFCATDYIAKKWKAKTKIVLDDRLRTTIRSQKYFFISTILFKIWSFFIVLSLVYSILAGKITIGLFTALIASTGAVLEQTGSLSHIIQNLRSRFLLIAHFYKFLSFPEIPSIEGEERIQSPYIVFDNVTFAYPKTDKVILDGISFEILPGEKVSLVGENGAGKSTIIKLLCRLYKPDSGRILINGVNLGELSQAQLRSVISIVFQDFCNYHLTLRENVAFGNIEKLHDDESLKLALKQGLATGLGDNLDLHLGKLSEDGVDLSGGQWQRVAIARACISDSAFVILDEPTASLDPVAESDLYHAFSEVLKNKGCIMISHRLASAKLADKIFVLDRGKVIETGSHAELMGQSGLYAKMFTAQSSWYKDGRADEVIEGEAV